MSFKDKILSAVNRIPKGKVASYSQVAVACGKPRAARAVGWILRGLNFEETIVPWWRVINNKGEISIKGNWHATKEMQKALLEKERVDVDGSFRVDMEKHRFRFK